MPKVVVADYWGNVVFDDGTLGKVATTKSDDRNSLVGKDKTQVVLI